MLDFGPLEESWNTPGRGIEGYRPEELAQGRLAHWVVRKNHKTHAPPF